MLEVLYKRDTLCNLESTKYLTSKKSDLVPQVMSFSFNLWHSPTVRSIIMFFFIFPYTVIPVACKLATRHLKFSGSLLSAHNMKKI